MERKIVFFAFMVLLGSMFAETFTWPPQAAAWVTSGVSVSPTVSSLSGNTICVNNAVTFRSDSSSSWNTAGGLDGQIASRASTTAQLIPFTTCPSANPIKWVDVAGFNLAANRFGSTFSNEALWNTYQGTVGAITEQDCGVRYLAPPPNPVPFNNNLYKSKLSVVCDGSYQLFVDGNPVDSGDYLGSQIDRQQTFASVGTHTVQSRITADCFLAAHSQLSPADNNINIHSNGFAPTQYNSAPLTVNVENPYTCPALSATGTIPQQCAGQQFPFSFTLTNPSSKDIQVYEVRLPTGSQFSNLQISTPFVVPAGGFVTVNGQVTAPTAPSTYALRIEFHFRTSTADCTGSQVDCGWQNVLISNVNVQVCGMTCTVTNPSGSCLTPGQTRAMTTHCYNNAGTEVPCPSLHWTTSLTSSSMAPIDTPANTNAPQSTLSVSSTAPVPQNGLVNAAENGGTGMVCTGATVCVQAGTATTCSLADVSGGNPMHPGDTHNYNATCLDSGGSRTTCPQFSWSTTGLTGASIIPPTPTPAGIAPQRALSFLPTAPAPQTGSISVSDGASLGCSAAVQVALPPPPNINCEISGNATLLPGQSASYTATCTDQFGDSTECPGLHWGTTLVNANMNPAYTAGPLFSPSSVLSTALTPAPQNGQVRARNESYSPQFTCTSANVAITNAPLLQPDLTENLSTPANLTLHYGETARVFATTRNIGNLSSQNVSITRLYLNGTMVRDFTIPDLAPNTESRALYNFNCGEGAPAIAVFNATADVTGTVRESNENNNVAAPGLSFTCGWGSSRPASCNFEPNATPIPMGGSQSFLITCYSNDTGLPIGCPESMTFATDCGPITFPEGPGIIVYRTNTICTNVTAAALDFNCTAIIADLPDIVTIIDVDDFTPNIGDVAHVNIWESNIGYLPAGPNILNVTVDNALSQYSVGTLNSGARFSTGTFEVPCREPGFITVRSYGDALLNVTEANERNNAAVAVINCGAVLACPDYV